MISRLFHACRNGARKFRAGLLKLHPLVTTLRSQAIRQNGRDAVKNPKGSSLLTMEKATFRVRLFPYGNARQTRWRKNLVGLWNDPISTGVPRCMSSSTRARRLGRSSEMTFRESHSGLCESRRIGRDHHEILQRNRSPGRWHRSCSTLRAD